MARSPFRRFPGEDLDGDLEEVGLWQDRDDAEVLVRRAGARAGADLAQDLFEAAGGTVELTGAGGVASAQACGGGALGLVLVATGVPSGQAAGAGHVARALPGAGALPTTETFGAAAVVEVRILLDAGGIPTAEAFDMPTVDLPAPPETGPGLWLGPRPRLRIWTHGAGGIPSAEAFGVPEVAVVAVVDGEDEEALAFVLSAVFGGAP